MSYRPLVLYDPDSDDSSSDGGSVGGRAHASMGIANDRCGRDNDSDRFSINSNLLEIISDDDMDDPMLYSAKYNPSHLRVEMGKRVGVDSDDESDGDGSHMGEDHDFRPSTQGTRLHTQGDIDEHSVGSDDEYGVRIVPRAFTRNDEEFDAMIPTGNPREDTTGGADQPADAFAEGDTNEEHAEKKASQKRRQEERYAEAEGKGQEALTKSGKRLSQKRLESKRLVAEALAKARSVKGTGMGARIEKQFLEGEARRLGRGNVAGATLSPAVKEKGARLLTRLGKEVAVGKAVQRGRLAEQFDERQKEEMGKARSRQAKAGFLAKVKFAGTGSSGEGQVVSGVGRSKENLTKSTKGTESNLQITLKHVERKVEGGADRVRAVRQLVNRNLKTKALATLLGAFREARALKQEEKVKKSLATIVRALRQNVAKTKAEAQLVRVLIEQKLTRERADAGVSALAKGGGSTVAESEAGISLPSLAGGGSTADPKSVSVPGGKGTDLGVAKLTAGNVVEIKPYGSQVRVYFNGDEIKATKGSTEADARIIEGLIQQIKTIHGATAFPEIRRKLGDRAKAIYKMLSKQ